MSSVNTYALQSNDGRLLASFDAFNLEEAQQRALQVTSALSLTVEWRLIELMERPRDVPMFNESYFAVLAQALHKMN